MHNVHFLLALMGRVRQAIIEDCFPDFLRGFFGELYGGDMEKVPGWAVNALRGVGFNLVDGRGAGEEGEERKLQGPRSFDHEFRGFKENPET